MLYACSLCRLIRRNPFRHSIACDDCFEEVSKFYLTRPQLTLTVDHCQFPMLSVYRYEDLIRTLILNAKAKCEWRSVEACQYLLANHHATEVYMEGVRGIIPAPSSLRSRLLGKFDLAFFLADALSNQFGAPVYQLPQRFYWRFRKQSMIPREFREKHGKVSSFVKRSDVGQSAKSSLLIVDDVVTTGSTVASIIKGKNFRRVKILTLASAYHRGTNDPDTT